MQNQTSSEYIPHLEIKEGGYCLGKNIVSDFTLRISRKAVCSAPWKKFGLVTRYVKFSRPANSGRWKKAEGGNQQAPLEGEELELPVKAMASPVAFRCFCYSHGNYNFQGGGRELGYLIQDLDADYEMREIIGQNV
jgi:hypothetical protein